jgi:phospholipase/carboxylesterase
MRKFWPVFVLVFATCAGQGDFKYLETKDKGIRHPGLIVFLHGYRSNEADLFSLAPAIETGFHVTSLRAPLDMQGGFGWFHIKFDDQKKVHYDYREVRKARDYVSSFISRICRERNLDSANVFLIGFSQGGMLAYDLALNCPSKIRGCVALGGALLAESKDKAAAAKSPKPAFFIGHGTMDDVVEFSRAKDAFAFLRQNSDVTMKEYPLKHGISQQEINDVRNWLRTKRTRIESR